MNSRLPSIVQATKDPQPKTRNSKPGTRNYKGQTAVVIALSIFVLIAIVGLAVDGGAMYVNRRSAQNSADAAATAATRLMLRQYEQMIIDNPDYDVDGTPLQEEEISQTLTVYAAAHGIPRANLEAFYVNDDKQIVTDSQVGSYNGVPWSLGAKGIAVRNRAITDSFFMRVFGWDKVGATAQAIAFMGITVDTSNLEILPLGLYTNTTDFDNLQFGQMYTLIEADITQGSGNWGWVDFNGNADSANVTRAWLQCGFNPSVSAASWPIWCPDYDTTPGWGPAQQFESAQTETYDPAEDPTYVPFLVYGYQSTGWWVAGSSGSPNANCRDFKQRVDSANGGSGDDYLFPIFDRVIPAGGSGTRYHLRVIADFFLQRGDVQCRPYTPPTPTPCPDCPPPPSGNTRDKWFVQGLAKNFYEPGATGRHGDLRHTSGHIVFLDN